MQGPARHDHDHELAVAVAVAVAQQLRRRSQQLVIQCAGSSTR
ncbi:hypothetical protein RAM_31800 [Amycolatopsis mediterranei S699]|uniref:Uncharacterized protein n=1 Tax=Amycolatopsis mediterranei (strain S699) TaxID=713604 RepID=A0A9R0UBK4_AMYMS|nr:hypothetical protein RAM_31800 [Amycolatopsis mediterranei S699]